MWPPMYYVNKNHNAPNYRENADMTAAMLASAGDVEDVDEEDALVCGVPRCPQSLTVWTDQARLDKHMYVPFYFFWYYSTKSHLMNFIFMLNL